jgi:hypothetical protein
MMFPPAKLRARILRGLSDFYDTEKRVYLRTALAEWAAFYKVKVPCVVLRRLPRIGEEWQLGLTREDNTVTLWPPAAWKAEPSTERVKLTKALYLRTVLHELGHVLFFVDCERRADLYAARFVKAGEHE